jgi:hypothetical protein
LVARSPVEVLGWAGPKPVSACAVYAGVAEVSVWVEDARSMQAKIRLARKMGFQGISTCALGQEDPAF